MSLTISKYPKLWIVTFFSFCIFSAQAQTKWDLASGYPANNFHTENLVQFAADVEKATAGKLKITVHANASLFKATEIKRAVQGGQAQAGEVIQANLQNEWQIYGADGLPFKSFDRFFDGDFWSGQRARRLDHHAAQSGGRGLAR